MESGEVPKAAARQAGLFTAAQAREAGWTGRMVRRRLASGRWIYVAGHAMAARPGDSSRAPGWTPFQLAMAAELTRPGVITSHTVAGLLHGFPLDPPKRVVEVITRGRDETIRGIVVHRLPIQESEVVVRPPDLRLTSPVRTALDLISTMPPARGLDLWAWVSTRQILDVEGLGEAIARRKRRRGRRRLQELLELVRGGAVSGAEFRLHELLQEAGIEGWEAGVRVSDAQGLIGVVDLLFRKRKLVIEVDGFRAHSSKEAFRNDRRRQNRLVAAGYTVLRFTWSDLTDRPQEVLTQVRAQLRAGI